MAPPPRHRRRQLRPQRPQPPPAAAAAPPLADDETPVAPKPADGIRTCYPAPAAPWLSEVGALPGGTVLRAAAIARVRLTYDDDKAGLRHVEEWEAVITPLSDPFDPAVAHHVDYDDRDLRDSPPTGAVYRLADASIQKASWWKAAQKSLTDHLVATLTLPVQRNLALVMWARADETPEAFANRCETVADMKADEEGAVLRAKLESRIDRVRVAMAEAQRKATDAEAEIRNNKNHELLGGAGDLLSVFLGGRRGARSIGRAIRNASGRHSGAARAEQRSHSAAEAANEKADELSRLETELSDALFQLDVTWSEQAKAIDVVRIPLERTDLVVVDFALCWLPIG